MTRIKGKVRRLPRKSLKAKRSASSAMGYGHFQADCPNKAVLAIREIEDLDHIKA